jgi:hypothetical protein
LEELKRSHSRLFFRDKPTAARPEPRRTIVAGSGTRAVEGVLVPPLTKRVPEIIQIYKKYIDLNVSCPVIKL